MGKVYEGIDPKLAAWLMAQPMFVVATAPLDEDRLINVSPKGMAGTFAVLDRQTVAYLDLTGSGIETIAHLRQNGRIAVMLPRSTDVRISSGCTDAARWYCPTIPGSPNCGRDSLTIPECARSSSSPSPGCPTPAATRCPACGTSRTAMCSTCRMPR